MYHVCRNARRSDCLITPKVCAYVPGAYLLTAPLAALLLASCSLRCNGSSLSDGTCVQ